MDDGYERTVSGLLRKRNEVLTEIFAIRERQGVLTNDLQSIERVLQTLGYEGNLEIGDRPPVRSRMILFHRTELQQHVFQLLQKADQPLSSRDLAIRFITSDGNDRYDKRLLLDIIKRVGKAILTLRKRGLVSGSREPGGRYVWRLVQGT